MASMESAYQGHTIMKPATRLFTEMVFLYRNDAARYQQLLKEANSMVRPKKDNEPVFMAWLAQNVSGAQLSELYLALQEIEQQVEKVKTIRTSLYESFDSSTVKKIKADIESSEFKSTHKRQWGCIISALNYMLQFANQNATNMEKQDTPQVATSELIDQPKVSIDLTPYTTILVEHFPKGYRLKSALDMKRLRRYYEEVTGTALVIDQAKVETAIRDCGIVYDGRLFMPQTMLSEEMKEQILSFIDRFSKGINTICYLTDNTQKEQETIFSFLDQYGLEMDQSKLMDILSKVYPALHQYLLPYRFGNALLDQYFQDYKYQKVINKILPEFEVEVEEQAKKREYNYILPPRTSVVESLNRKDAQLYFMDAMGVEYLGYILAVCKELNMIANVKVCVAELPSITSRNKEFLDLFADAKYQTVSIKDIDDIKHHGKYDFDFYKNSKLPIHLIKELEVIRTALVKIRNDLLESPLQRVFMIADHGASRLAVLHDTENVWEMAESGQHSGRFCPKSDVDEKPEFAADAGDFWALANYDRFKGGRRANVEVHGGATLEELCVPIIELTYMAEKPEIALMPIDSDDFAIGDIPEIEVSFRKKAALKIFSTVSLQNASLSIDGTFYPAIDLGNNCYRVDMHELKKQGTYYADVCSGDNVLAENLPFVIKKEGQKERSLL